jgi:hypothetical protein
VGMVRGDQEGGYAPPRKTRLGFWVGAWVPDQKPNATQA